MSKTDLFDETTVRRMVDHWTRLLDAAAGDPAASLRDLPLLSAMEERQLLVDWNATARSFALARPAGVVRQLSEPSASEGLVNR